jgi:hypothetical protein
MALELRRVKSVFDMLFGKECEISDSKPLEISPKNVIGTFKNGEDEVCGAIVFDNSLACFSGAALSMIPMGAAEDCISSGEISSVIMDNINEVFNVAVGFFSDGTTPDMRLEKMHVNEASVPDKVNELISNSSSLHFEADIQGYGKGTASVFML